MQPKSVLAVTATAGPRVIQDISHTLGIAKQDCEDDCENPLDNENILVIDKARDNIDVSCEFVAHHEERLDMVSGFKMRLWVLKALSIPAHTCSLYF